MKSETGNDKICGNCRYYSQHYSKQDCRFKAVYCGYCLNRDGKDKKKKPSEYCERWEDIALKKEERKKTVIEILESISKSLQEISVVLKDDQNGS